MKPRLTCLAIGAVLVASACSSSHPEAGHADPGAVFGQYRLTGGPAPGLDRPQVGTIWAYPGALELSALAGTTPSAHVRTDAAGNFTLSLKPGEYTLSGTSGASRSNSCGGPAVVHIKASVRTRVELVCSVP